MGLLSRIDSIQQRLGDLESTADENCCTFSYLQSDEKKLFEYPFMRLHDFFISIGVAQFCFFLKYNKKYYLVFNHGFSFDTTLQSTCSSEFWSIACNCQLEENTWYTLESPNIESILQLFSAEDREKIQIAHVKSVNIGNFNECIIIASQSEKNAVLTDLILDHIDENFDYVSEHLLNISQFYENSKLSLEKNTEFYEDDILEKCINNNFTCLMLKLDLSIFYDELCIHNTKTDSLILQNCLIKIFNDFIEDNYFFAQKDFSNFKYLIFSNRKFNFSTFLKKFSLEIEKYFSQKEIDKISFELNGFSKDCDEIMSFMNETRRQF